jgi:hypothetical protein
LVLAGVLMLVACGGRDAKTPAATSKVEPSPAAEPAAEPDTAPVTARLDHPRIEVLEPGAEPRRVLHYAPTLADRAITLTLASTVALDLGIAAIPPTKAPALRMRLEGKTRTRDGGDFVLSLVPSKVEAIGGEGSGPLGAGMRPTLEALERLHAELVLGPDGALLETSLELPPTPGTNGPTEAERLQNAFAQLFVAMPTEPIGLGARWTVSQTLPLAGERIEQTSSFTLTEVAGDQVTVELGLEQRPAAKDAPRAEASGDHTTLDALKTEGNGTIHVDLRHFGPVEGRSHSRSEVTQTIVRDGQRQQVSFSLELDLTLTGDPISPDAP